MKPYNSHGLQMKMKTYMNSLQETFQSMAVSIGIVMQNAATNQHNGQNIANACLAVCCKLIITKGAAAA